MEAWEEFRKSGLLWWTNRTLHIFGWAIFYDYEDGTLIRVYPKRTNFRGFDDISEDEGFINLSTYLKKNSAELLKECKNENV